MPRNLTGGKKAKKMKNHTPDMGKRPMIWAEDQQVYGKVEKMLGDMRCLVHCQDGVHRLCRIRGKLRKRVWIHPDDVILISLRDFQDEKGEIIHKYNAEETILLVERNEFVPDRLRASSAGGGLVSAPDDNASALLQSLLQSSDEGDAELHHKPTQDHDDEVLIDFNAI